MFNDILVLKKTGYRSVCYDFDGVKWVAFKRVRNKYGKNKKKGLRK